jgi:hypothetical protein
MDLIRKQSGDREPSHLPRELPLECIAHVDDHGSWTRHASSEDLNAVFDPSANQETYLRMNDAGSVLRFPYDETRLVGRCGERRTLCIDPPTQDRCNTSE